VILALEIAPTALQPADCRSFVQGLDLEKSKYHVEPTVYAIPSWVPKSSAGYERNEALL
jgi:hypothetical protein